MSARDDYPMMAAWGGELLRALAEIDRLRAEVATIVVPVARFNMQDGGLLDQPAS